MVIMQSDSPNNILPLCANGEACPYSQELDGLRDQLALLKTQVRTDALTGLYNFRFLSETLPLEMERARRSFQPLSLILLDVDRFKAFNDKWGHDAGNLALQYVANIIAQTLRKLDFACRFGGEEFAIILPNTKLRQAVNVSERLRERLETSPLELPEGDIVTITASLGVDQFSPVMMESQEQFLKRVDELLYQAKNLGRNRVAHQDIQEVPETQVTQAEKDILFGVFRNDAEP
jgi:diguanylate cyclase (GGDEF)-like protein